MDKKLVKEYLIITFSIMIVFWGICVLTSKLYDIGVDNVLLRIFQLIGGFSPTIASYISLKRNGKVNGFKDWLNKVFDIKHSIGIYILVLLFTCILFNWLYS